MKKHNNLQKDSFLEGVDYYNDADYKSAYEIFKKLLEDKDFKKDRVELYLMTGYSLLSMDESKGVDYIKKAAKLGSCDALDSLGDFHLYGSHGITSDQKEALNFYTKSCKCRSNYGCKQLFKLLDTLKYDRMNYIQEMIGTVEFISIIFGNFWGGILKFLFQKR